MSALGAPTMTDAEVAEWERRLRSGSLFNNYATTRRCVCGHAEGNHAGFRAGYPARYREGTRCPCDQFEAAEASE